MLIVGIDMLIFKILRHFNPTYWLDKWLLPLCKSLNASQKYDLIKVLKCVQ